MIVLQIFIWLIAGYFGYKTKWFYVFLLGLGYDLVAGGALGVSSVKFLGLGIVIYLVKEYWPLKIRQQLRLKL